LLDFLKEDPIGFFVYMLYRAPAVLLALTLHELAHGYAAYLCGDTTARDRGRLTLNPLKHLDPVGTLMMFFAGMGWARPVPVNPYRFRNKVRDDLFVSIAGVTVNFILFFVSTLVLTLIANPLLNDDFTAYYGYRFFLSFRENGFLYLLSGEKELLSKIIQTPWLLHVARFLMQFSLVNLGMCIFNLLPIPPLDGFHVFNDILLKGKISLTRQAFQYSMLALFVLMYTTDIFSKLINAVIHAVQSGVLTLFLTPLGLS